MKCPTCGGETIVKDGRFVENNYRRRRECTKCKIRFTTYEMIDDDYHYLKGSIQNFKDDLSDFIKKYGT